MNGGDRKSAGEGSGLELAFEPTRIERLIDGSNPQTAPVEGQVGGIDDVGEFRAVGLVKRRHQGGAQGVCRGGGGGKGGEIGQDSL